MGSTREHPVAGHAPDWSRPSQAFRHLDGRLPDLPADRNSPCTRSVPRKRGLRERAAANLRNLGVAVVNYFAPTPRQRLVFGTFLIGMMWGVMCAIGMMAAWGIHP
jgi:hypothetical protein